MPLSINVGLSRKASRDYQSTGVSINVTAELDQSLLARPEELQQQVGDLYAQARQALDRQTSPPAPAPQSRSPRTPPRSGRTNGNYGRNGGGGTRGNDNGNRNGHGQGHREGGGMTESQRNAILSIARRADLDAGYEAEQIIGVPLDDLTVRQASDLIDHLKSFAPAGNGR